MARDEEGRLTPDVEFSLFSSVELVTKLVLDSLVGSPNGRMYIEITDNNGSKNGYIPKNWPFEWPCADWVETSKPARIRLPHHENTLYLGYIGHEHHRPPESKEYNDYATILAVSMQVEEEDPAPFINLLTFSISFDHGEQWTKILEMDDVQMSGGLGREQMAYTLQVALARFGAIITTTTITPNKKDNKETFGKIVLDNTFFNEYNQLWVEDPEERNLGLGGIGVAPPFEPTTSGFLWEYREPVYSGYSNFSGYSGWNLVSGHYYSGVSVPGYSTYWEIPYGGPVSGETIWVTNRSGCKWFSGYSGAELKLWYSGYSGYSGWSGYSGKAIVADNNNRVAVHAGTWGVIKSSEKIIASTTVPVYWAQNSTAKQIPVADSPFCYAVNKPRDLLWMGPMGMREVTDDSYFGGLTQGPPRKFTPDPIPCPIAPATHELVYGECTDHGFYFSDGLSPQGVGWIRPVERAYWVPDYTIQHLYYSFPYIHYAEPIDGTTIVLLNQDKTEGDIPVNVMQFLDGSTGRPYYCPQYAVNYTWHYDPGGENYYGYMYNGETIYDPYATSMWTYTAFHKYVLDTIKSRAQQVGEKLVLLWGGIPRTQVRGVAKRRQVASDPYLGMKSADWVMSQFSVMGEYSISQRYNTMRVALRTEMQFYATYLQKLLMADAGASKPTGGNFFEYIASKDNSKHYDVNILPSKSFGKTIYGIKSYRERTGFVERKQGDGSHVFRQGQYGMVRFCPVISQDGGITWEDVTGLTAWNNDSSQVQYKPVSLGNGAYVCEHDTKLFRSIKGVGWSPMPAVDYSEETLSEWLYKLGPDIHLDKTYLLECAAPGEFVVAHQFEDLPEWVVEELEIIDRQTLRGRQNSILEVDFISAMNGKGQYVTFDYSAIFDQNYILLHPSNLLDNLENPVYARYRRKTAEVGLYHVVCKRKTGGSPELVIKYVKEIKYIGAQWHPYHSSKPDLGAYWQTLYTLSGGVHTELFPGDRSYRAVIAGRDVTPVTIEQTSIEPCVIDYDYTDRIEAIEGTQPYKYTFLNLPRGLTYDRNTGEIEGKPEGDAAIKEYHFIAIVDDKTSILNVSAAGVLPVPTRAGVAGATTLYGFVMEKTWNELTGEFTENQPLKNAKIKVWEGGRGNPGAANYIAPRQEINIEANAHGYFDHTFIRTLDSELTATIPAGLSEAEAASWRDQQEFGVGEGYFKTLRFSVTVTASDAPTKQAVGSFDCPIPDLTDGSVHRVDMVVVPQGDGDGIIGVGTGTFQKEMTTQVKLRVDGPPLGLDGGPKDQKACVNTQVSVDVFFEYSPTNPEEQGDTAGQLIIDWSQASNAFPLYLEPALLAVDSTLSEYISITGDKFRYDYLRKRGKDGKYITDNEGRVLEEYEDFPYGRKIAKFTISGNITDKEDDGFTIFQEPKTFMTGGLRCIDSQGRTAIGGWVYFTAYPVGKKWYTYDELGNAVEHLCGGGA